MFCLLYEIHLARSYQNCVGHMQYCLALVSLRLENQKRIRQEILDMRKGTLEGFCKVLGVPFGPMHVSTDLSHTGAAHAFGNPNGNVFLTMVRDADATLNIGAVHPLTAEPASQHKVDSNTSADCIPQLAHRQRPRLDLCGGISSGGQQQ